MRNLITRFVREEDGMEFVEWALVAALFALAGVGAWTQLNADIATALGSVGASLIANTN